MNFPPCKLAWFYAIHAYLRVQIMLIHRCYLYWWWCCETNCNITIFLSYFRCECRCHVNEHCKVAGPQMVTNGSTLLFCLWRRIKVWWPMHNQCHPSFQQRWVFSSLCTPPHSTKVSQNIGVVFSSIMNSKDYIVISWLHIKQLRGLDVMIMRSL